MVAPVAGFTMGIALRPRVAAGWCSLKELDGWLRKAGGTKGGDDELREKAAGATCWGCWVGEDSGELLAREDRSDPLCMEDSW